jgi:hypothetical protein
MNNRTKGYRWYFLQSWIQKHVVRMKKEEEGGGEKRRKTKVGGEEERPTIDITIVYKRS